MFAYSSFSNYSVTLLEKSPPCSYVHLFKTLLGLISQKLASTFDLFILEKFT